MTERQCRTTIGIDRLNAYIFRFAAITRLAMDHSSSMPPACRKSSQHFLCRYEESQRRFGPVKTSW